MWLAARTNQGVGNAIRVESGGMAKLDRLPASLPAWLHARTHASQKAIVGSFPTQQFRDELGFQKGLFLVRPTLRLDPPTCVLVRSDA